MNGFSRVAEGFITSRKYISIELHRREEHRTSQVIELVQRHEEEVSEQAIHSH